jgi:hypothetical protein
VFDSGLSIQEIPDINRLSAFANLTEGASFALTRSACKVLSKAWGALKGGTQWRENVLRYAAYLTTSIASRRASRSPRSATAPACPKMVDAVRIRATVRRCSPATFSATMRR